MVILNTWEEINSITNMDNSETLNLIIDYLSEILDTTNLLGVASIGRWDGTYEGGCFIKDKDTLYKLFNYDEIVINLDKDGLYIDGHHHDGCDKFHIKELSHKGSQILEDWEYDYDDKRTQREIYTETFNVETKMDNLNGLVEYLESLKIEDYDKE